uniref:WD40 repeat domain-containing protein n=1 Tax=Paractinoplanes polyasparticus TaxID=2856853 RepID=UPI001C846037|nr:WD40 repeat domain-containing protein [Actinoplanes polyasparticus]
MDRLESLSTKSGWVEDPVAAPHLVLREGIDETQDAALVTVRGRAVLAMPAADGDSGLVKAVDLSTGTVLPDRSLLRRARHEVLAVGAGRLLATLGQQDGAVVVRDAVTGAPVGVPIRQANPIRSLALALVDGQPLVITTGSGLAVWDVATGALIVRHERINGRHFATYRGRLLLMAEESARSLQLYDVLTGEPLGHPVPCDFCMSVYRLTAVEHDGRLLVAFLDSHHDTKVTLWDPIAGVELHTAPPGDDVREIDLATSDGRPLLLVARSAGSGSPPTLWDPVTGRQVLPDFFAGYEGDCRQVALASLDDGFAAVTVDGGSAELWVSSSDGRRRTALAGDAVWRAELGLVDGSPTVAVGGPDASLRLFDVRTGQEFSSPFYGGPVSSRILGTLNRAGRALAVLSGRPMRLWDVGAGVPVAQLNRSADGIIRSAAGELDGRTVIALVSGTGLDVWDPGADAVVCRIPLEHVMADGPGSRDVIFTEIEGCTAVAVATARTVHAWDAATGEPLGRPYRGVGKSISALTAGRIGDRPVLAVSGHDQQVHVFDPATGDAVVPPLAGHSQRVTALALGVADGRTVVASGGYDNTVRVWDVATGASAGGPWSGHSEVISAVRVTEWNGEPVVVSHTRSDPPRMWRLRAPAGDSGHTDAVRAVAAGRWAGRPVFASGSADRTVRLWDAATGRSFGPALTDHSSAVTHVTFAGPDRDILVTADEVGDVLRWQVRAGAPHSEPLARLGAGVSGLGTADVGGRPVVGAGTADGVLRVWDAVTSEPQAELRTGAPTGRTDLGVLDGRLVALTIARDGSDDDSALTLWDALTGKPLYGPMTVPEESDTLGTLATVDGRLVVVQGLDAFESGSLYHPAEAADVRVIDVATRTVLRRYRPKRGWSQHATVARAATRTVVLVAADDSVAVIDPYQEGGPAIKDFEYTGHGAYVTCSAATEIDGRMIVASGDSGNGLHFWNLDTGERFR